MPKIDPDYRANVDRAVEVFGEFSDSLVSRLAPQILRLRQQGDAPISVFINSPGGVARCLDFIHGLLTSKGPGGKRPRLITVAIGDAKSAAANLLALGDYSIAYPKADIHFHGLRYGEAEDVTMETASAMAAHLHMRNRQMAAQLTRAATERLAFHYAQLKKDFDDIKKAHPHDQKPDIVCFSECLKEQLSSAGERIVDQAIKRWLRLRELSKKVLQSVKKTNKTGIEFEERVFRGMINYQVRRNPDSPLNEPAVWQVASDYLLLRDYDTGRHTQLTKGILERWHGAFLEKGELESVAKAIENPETQEEAAKQAYKRTEEVIKPFCYFAASMWDALQEEENPLTPSDAYWLGAVDEVLDSNLPCAREIVESETPEQGSLL